MVSLDNWTDVIKWCLLVCPLVQRVCAPCLSSSSPQKCFELLWIALNSPCCENCQMHQCCLWRVLGLKITIVSRSSGKWVVQALGQLLQIRNFLQDVYTGDLCTVKQMWAVHTTDWVALQSRFFLSRFHVQCCSRALIEILPGFRNPFVIVFDKQAKTTSYGDDEKTAEKLYLNNICSAIRWDHPCGDERWLSHVHAHPSLSARFLSSPSQKTGTR